MKNIIKKLIVVPLIFATILCLASCEKLKSDLKLDVKDFLDEYVFNNKKEISEKNVSGDIVSTISNVNNDTYDKFVTVNDDTFTLSQYKLPKIGDEIGGFKTLNIYDFDERNAKVVEFYHEKTGATAFLISNDDEDKYAALGFNTLAYDDKGVPHVFEHATLGGSEKYNSSNLFFEMTNKTYDTFLNALTMQCVTAYPMGSLSDEQLFSYFKVYIDGVFNPNILRNNKNFEREAYRYILENKDADLNLSGVVYSEMSAHEGSIFDKSYDATAKTLFNKSFVSSNTGGVIKDIPKMTYDELLEFHKTYYTPSNMVMLLYGDIDYSKYLNYANDEYLVKFGKETIDKSDKYYTENNGFVKKTYDFPVASGSEVKNGSIITYAVSFEGLTAYESGIAELLLYELNKDDGPLAIEVNENLEYALYTVENHLWLPKPYISIVFSNVNEDDDEKIKEIVENAFKALKENGISKENFSSFIDMRDMSYELNRDSHGFGDDVAIFYCSTFMNNGDDLLGYFKYYKGLKDIELRYNDGTIDSIIKKYLSNNNKSVISIVAPRAGLLEKKNEEFVNSLKELKNSMTDEEIEKLIKENNEYNEWVEYNNSISIIDKVRVASVSGLPEYKAKCYAYEENIEGVRFIRSDIDDIKYSYCDILLDASGVPYEDTLKLKLLSEILLYLPTTNYEDFKLSSEFSRYAYSYGTSIYTNRLMSGGYTPYLSFSFMALDKNLDKVFELYKELMYETIFSDTAKLKNFALQGYNDMKQSFNDNPSSYASAILDTKILPHNQYDFHISGIDYMNYLKEITLMTDKELEKLLHECEEILYNLYNRNGMVCEIISNFKTMSDIKNRVLKLSSDFKIEKIVPCNYDEMLKKYGDKVGVKSESYVSYNYIGIPLKENEIEFSSKLYVLDNLINDKILYPEFRVKRGAYGAYAESSLDYMSIHTYRDPNMKETYDVIKTIPDVLHNLNITNEELEDYKLNAYAKFSYPLTKLGAATTAVSEILENWTEKRPERFIKYMKDIKNTSIEDIEMLKNSIKTLIDKGYIVSISGSNTIEKNIDIFDEIIYDYIGN